MSGALWLGIAMLALGLLTLGAISLARLLRSPRTASRSVQYAGLGSETVAAPPPSQAAGFDARFPAVPRRQLPVGFDVGKLLRAARDSFIRLQMASGSGRLDELREVTTSEMFETLRAEAGAGPQGDVLTLNADLLEVGTEDARHWASVRFSGLAREIPGTEPQSFEEVWSLVKPVDGSSGWRLAGIRQMH